MLKKLAANNIGMTNLSQTSEYGSRDYPRSIARSFLRPIISCALSNACSLYTKFHLHRIFLTLFPLYVVYAQGPSEQVTSASPRPCPLILIVTATFLAGITSPFV